MLIFRIAILNICMMLPCMFLKAQDYNCILKSADQCGGLNRVVAAQDLSSGLPGGSLSLNIEINGGDATLSIERISGNSGSAVFFFNGSETNTIVLPPGVYNNGEIQILGKNVSDEARNMKVKLLIASKEIPWSFTVFKVDVTAFISGHISEYLPVSAMSDAGSSSTSILDLYLFTTRNLGLLGHNIIQDSNPFNRSAYGGILLRARIIPSGMSIIDFNTCHSRDLAFNWGRTLTARSYPGAGCYLDFNSAFPWFISSDNISDDTGPDSVEDLIPNVDLSNEPNELYLWAIDAPNVVQTQIPSVGDIVRTRYNFNQSISYGGTKIAPDVNWSWRASIQNIGSMFPMVQNNDFTSIGDNSVTLDAGVLTSNLQPASNPPFNINQATPSFIPLGQTESVFISGNNLNTSQTCSPLVYMVREESASTMGHISVIPIENSQVSNSFILGDFNTANAINLPSSSSTLKGEYDMKVFIESLSETASNTINVN